MASINRANKITIDAFSDTSNEFLGNSGVYSKFTNRLNTPIINAKGIQILNANFVNSALQLNDGYQLMFFYYASLTQAGIRTAAQLRCVRLHPSSFVPAASFTAFTRNAYFNSVQELVAALNLAASTGGDNTTYNPRWVANQVTFSYNADQRKISVVGNSSYYIAPAAADDPFVADFLNNTGSFTNQRPVMNAYTSSNTYATATLQPFVVGQSMNARLGFAMGYFTRGRWWGSTSQQGCATATGVPLTGTAIEADANPILLGAQNVNVYIDIVSGSGLDSLNNKSLAGSIPIEVAPLNVNSYTLSSVEKPLVNVPAEIYEITCELRDELGQPFVQPPNFNTQISFSVYYD